MTSPIKLENHLNRHQSHHGSMGKNLHLSEVITTAAATSNQHYHGLVGQHRHNVMVDPIEMTKLLSNITTSNSSATHSSVNKPVSTSSNMDYSSRLNHFSWEEIEGRYLPVIFRNENGCLQRYTSKMFVENTLFQSESWQRHAILARSLPPLISFPYTENEFKLFRLIVEWHLAGFNFKTILPSDCLIRFEDLLDFYTALRKLRDKPSSTSFNRPLAPPPIPPPMPVAPPPPPPPPPPKQRIFSNGLAQSFELPTMGDNPPLKSPLSQHRHPSSTSKTYPVPSLHPSSNYHLQQTTDHRHPPPPPFTSATVPQSFNFTNVASNKTNSSVLPPPTSAQWNEGLSSKTHDKHRAPSSRPMIPMNPSQHHHAHHHPTASLPLPPAPTSNSDSIAREKHSQPPAKFHAAPMDSSIQQIRETKESGWVQINNVFVPYIVKHKLRENDLEKCSTRQPPPQLQRELYVPYEILIKCHIFSDHEFAFKKFLIKATQQDFDIFNSLISNINIFDEKVPEKTLLVNLYHVMIGLQRVLYVKLLTTKQPRTQVNKYHADVLTHKGGTLLMPENKLVPYIIQNNRFYVPLLYAYQSVPNVLSQAKRGARAPRQYEIDYLNLLFLYFSIDAPPLTSDTLLVDAFAIKLSNYQQPIHFRTLNEHQQYERNRLSNTLARLTQNNNKIPTNKTPNNLNKIPVQVVGASSQKSNKCPPANVVVNPLIHHPSFYGLTSASKSTSSAPAAPAASSPILSSPLPSNSSQPSIKINPIKTIVYDHQTLNAIVKSVDLPLKDWKISIRHIFEKFAFEIDYDKFLQWCLNNSLLPLVKLDDEEKRIVTHQIKDDDFYVYQRHLERCVSLLNDLKRGTISMTLLPSSNNEMTSPSSSNVVTSTLAGAKKRKPIAPTARHTSSIVETSSTLPFRSPELRIHEENPLVTSEETSSSPIRFRTEPVNEKTNRTETNDDDDAMPIVATVEEEQTIEEMKSSSSETDTSLIIVETNEGDETKIQLDDTLPSCSSGYESAAALTNVDTHIQNHPSSDDEEDGVDDDDTNSTTRSRLPSLSCQSEHSLALIPSNPNDHENDDGIEKKRKTDSSSPVMMSINDRQQIKNGKYRQRSRSPSSLPSAKKIRSSESTLPLSDNTITSDQIEQHLRTLLMPMNEQRRTRTRPIKTPTRLVEEISNQYSNKVAAVASVTDFEPNNNHMFETCSSSPNSTTNETSTLNRSDSEGSNMHQSCTYNVTMSDKPNKLGLTIKKVVQR